MKTEEHIDGPGTDIDDDDIDTISRVLRKTDAWFAYRVHELETTAKEFAASHAAVGQPRHDLPHSEPLEVEVVLARRGAEILRNWADRVRLKIRGAMELEIESLYSAVSESRQALADASNASADRQVPVISIARHLHPWIAGVLLALLVAADLFANLPVFVELLPTNSQSASALLDWEAQQLASGLSFSFGLRRLLQSLATSPEPALLGLSVILFFLFLGHKAGTYLRQAIALSPSRSMRTHSRQAVVPLVMCAAGIALTITFLFWARATVKPLTEQRLASAEQTLAAVNAEIDQLTKQGADIGPVMFQRQAAATAERNYRRDRVDYGSTLSAVNVPILFLNIVLVIAAALIGYATAAGSFSSDAGHCEREEVQHRNAAHEALRRAERTLARIRHLCGADVLKDLEAKKSRIACAVPLFRTENARLRGLDVADILAFRLVPPVYFPSADELGIRIDMPAEVTDLEINAQRLRHSICELEPCA